MGCTASSSQAEQVQATSGQPTSAHKTSRSAGSVGSSNKQPAKLTRAASSQASSKQQQQALGGWTAAETSPFSSDEGRAVSVSMRHAVPPAYASGHHDSVSSDSGYDGADDGTELVTDERAWNAPPRPGTPTCQGAPLEGRTPSTLSGRLPSTRAKSATGNNWMGGKPWHEADLATGTSVQVSSSCTLSDMALPGSPVQAGEEGHAAYGLDTGPLSRIGSAFGNLANLADTKAGSMPGSPRRTLKSLSPGSPNAAPSDHLMFGGVPKRQSPLQQVWMPDSVPPGEVALSKQAAAHQSSSPKTTTPAPTLALAAPAAGPMQAAAHQAGTRPSPTRPSPALGSVAVRPAKEMTQMSLLGKQDSTLGGGLASYLKEKVFGAVTPEEAARQAAAEQAARKAHKKRLKIGRGGGGKGKAASGGKGGRGGAGAAGRDSGRPTAAKGTLPATPNGSKGNKLGAQARQRDVLAVHAGVPAVPAANWKRDRAALAGDVEATQRQAPPAVALQRVDSPVRPSQQAAVGSSAAATAAVFQTPQVPQGGPSLRHSVAHQAESQAAGGQGSSTTGAGSNIGSTPARQAHPTAWGSADMGSATAGGVSGGLAAGFAKRGGWSLNNKDGSAGVGGGRVVRGRMAVPGIQEQVIDCDDDEDL